MILLPLLLQAATAPALAGLARQDLPAAGCAAFLWSPLDRRLVAMANAEPPRLRLAPNGKTVDLPRSDASGTGALGLPALSSFGGGGITATLEMTVTTRAELTDGGLVPQATLRIDEPGHDTLVMPLAGMVGCRKPPT